MALRAILVMVAAASLLATASPAGGGSPEDCAARVIRDWYANGRVDKLYPLGCYRAAIRALPDDVLQYTDADHDIARALEQARQGRPDARRSRPAAREPAKPSAGAAAAPAPAPSSPAPRAASASEPASGSQGPPLATRARTERAAPTAAEDEMRVRAASGATTATGGAGVPYPLIALAALAPVLLLAGLGSALARRRR